MQMRHNYSTNHKSACENPRGPKFRTNVIWNIMTIANKMASQGKFLITTVAGANQAIIFIMEVNGEKHHSEGKQLRVVTRIYIPHVSRPPESKVLLRRKRAP